MTVAQPQPRLEAAQPRTLGALRHRNYRLYIAGQIISTIGTWMQSIAQPWLALQLTHDGFKVGLVFAAQFTPMLVGGALGGIVADRFPKRNVLVATQVAFMVPALFLFLVSNAGLAQYWMLLVGAFSWGLVQVFDVPARQSFVIDMVGREDLINAISLNSVVWNGAAVIGPSIAGVLIAILGVPLCFLLNAVGKLATIGALLLMRNLPRATAMGDQPIWRRIVEGAAYSRGNPVVGMMLVLVAIFSLFAMNRLTLVPLFADQVLKVGAAGFGLFMGCVGAGALAGAFTLAVFARRASGQRQFYAGIAWALALIVFSVSRMVWLSAVLLFLAGFCQMVFLNTANARVQIATPNNLRGRVMALYAQALMGVSPIGSSQAGALAHFFGAPWAMAIGASIAGGCILAIRLIRPEVFTLDPEQSIPP
jgi:MFS family permease